MGRFVEEDMTLPEGVDTREVISLVYTPAGYIELYAINLEKGIYEKYSYADMKWNVEEPEALQSFSASGTSNYIISDIFYGEDQKQYLLVDAVPYHSELYRLSDDGSYEKVDVKRFDETYEVWDDFPYRPKYVKVLENGMIAASYLWRVIKIYSPDGQTTIDQYNCGRSCILAVDGNNLYYSDQKDEELLEINMETMNEGVSRVIETELSDTGILDYDDGTAYLCDVDGIHLNKEGGVHIYFG